LTIFSTITLKTVVAMKARDTGTGQAALYSIAWKLYMLPVTVKWIYFNNHSSKKSDHTCILHGSPMTIFSTLPMQQLKCASILCWYIVLVRAPTILSLLQWEPKKQDLRDWIQVA